MGMVHGMKHGREPPASGRRGVFMRTRFPGLSYIPGLVRSCASYPQPNYTNLTKPASLSTDSARKQPPLAGREGRKEEFGLGQGLLEGLSPAGGDRQALVPASRSFSWSPSWVKPVSQRCASAARSVFSLDGGAGSQRRRKEGASALQALAQRMPRCLRRSSQVKVKTTNACRGIALFVIAAL